MASKAVKTQMQKIADYQSVFGTTAGARVLQDLMHTHYIMDSTYSDKESVFFLREGERNVVLRILSILKMDLNQLKERIDNDEKIRGNETIV